MRFIPSFDANSYLIPDQSDGASKARLMPIRTSYWTRVTVHQRHDYGPLPATVLTNSLCRQLACGVCSNWQNVLTGNKINRGNSRSINRSNLGCAGSLLNKQFCTSHSLLLNFKFRIIKCVSNAHLNNL